MLVSMFQKKSRLIEADVKKIRENPRQPRKLFREESLEELASSIQENGLIQPITVRRSDDGFYELIAGERRWRASMMAGLEKIPAILVDANPYDSAAIALIENVQRENLCYLDEAEALSNLIHDFGLTQEELARRIGKTQATIANKIRLLRLTPAVKKLLREHDLTERHARALLRLDSEELQLKTLEAVCSKRLNVAQTDRLVDGLLAEREQKKPYRLPPRIFKDVRIFTNTIKQAVELMQQSGIQAVSEKKEDDKFIEYTIRIPKE